MLLLLLVAGLDARVFGKKSVTVQMKANQNAANFTITIGVIVSRSSKTGPTTYLSSMYPSHGGGGVTRGLNSLRLAPFYLGSCPIFVVSCLCAFFYCKILYNVA